MRGLLQQAIQDPFAALSFVLGDTLHPGGAQATADLLDRARVGQGTRVLDLGCGAGAAGRLALQRGAQPIGLDRDPGAEGATLCARLERLPMAAASTDVVLSECALCLADDLAAALAEAHRVLAPDGRLAFSDVVLERPIEGLPTSVSRALCLTGERSRQRLQGRVEAAGFAIVDERDHHEDLVAMRKRVREHVDVEGLLGAMGPQGRALLAGIQDLETALEARELGYVSIVAEPAPS